jgi:hypothetical protein
MTTTNETTDETVGVAQADGKTRPAAGTDAAEDAEQPDGVAEAAARDVARLLDRRGLREVVALAHRVVRESTRLTTTGGPRSDDTETNRCTLRQHERPTRRGAAGRATDDDRA